MTIDVDTRRAAQRLIQRYGARAIDHAERRVAALEAKHDREGVATWRRITAAVAELQRGAPSAKDRKK